MDELDPTYFVPVIKNTGPATNLVAAKPPVTGWIHAHVSREKGIQCASYCIVQKAENVEVVWDSKVLTSGFRCLS